MFARACAEIVFFLNYFFAFPFSPFLIFLLHWLAFYWACFQFKSSRESIIETGNAYRGVAKSLKCSRKKFCSKLFTQISEHFCAYFRLHWPDHSDLGIIGIIFSCCRMPILVKVDVRSGTKAWPTLATSFPGSLSSVSLVRWEKAEDRVPGNEVATLHSRPHGPFRFP